MGQVFRNVAFAVALLAVLLVSSEVFGRPSQKERGGEDKGRGKGRRSVADAEEENVSALEGAVYDALAEDAEADALLDDRVRERRAVDADSNVSALVEDSDDVAAIQETGGEGRGQLKAKKPCRGGRGRGGGGGDNNGTDTNSTDGEAENMRQRQGRRSGRNRAAPSSTPEPPKLVSWFGDEPEEIW